MVLNIEVAERKFCISITTVFLRGQAEYEMKGKGRKTQLKLIRIFLLQFCFVPRNLKYQMTKL